MSATTPPVLLSAPTADDPFTSPGRTNSGPHRYASFDNQSFSLYSSNSPSQARRALEAHLKDTDRRIQDASRLGQTLVQQRKDLAERLKEVEHEKDDNEIGPELQKKLSELEKEYTEVGKESARAFMPKGRIISQDFSVHGSPAVFAGASTASPSKFAAPSRKQRNQPTNRVHDIEFATEISTSLLAQVRSLQAILAEKEDTLRTTTSEKTQLEDDVAGLMLRLKMLDENEQKYKEENWNLETQLQEIQAALKHLTDKEQRLNLILKTTQAEKDAAQRELEELKHAHGKLAEDHETVRKQNDSEINGLRRDVASHESERDSLNKRVAELTAQNTELARAVASRWNSDDRSPSREYPFPEDEQSLDRLTPDDSPIPSPSKTPARNGQLESETLRSSLTHAHRMIQNLKNNIHREKTEKIELRRMLQDARDELETLREAGPGPAAKKRRSEQENSKFKKPNRADKLGATRNSTHEIIMDDDEWEDQEVSPSRAATMRQVNGMRQSSAPYDYAAYADRDSTDAFETANEREGTTEESEAFQTGVESLGARSSSDDLTETEDTSRRDTVRMSRPSVYATGNPGDRRSYMSTASTDDEGFDDVRTPVQQQHPKLRLRNVRGRKSSRVSEVYSESGASFNDSPGSVQYSDSNGTPASHVGQNLMAELEGLSDEDEEELTEGEGESASGTPNRHLLGSAISTRSAGSRPGTARSLAVSSPTVMGGISPARQPRPRMVDSGMMTEPWKPEEAEHKSALSTAAGVVGGAIAGAAGYALGKTTSNDKEISDADEVKTPDENAKELVESPEQKTLMSDDLASPRKEAAQRANMGTPRARAPVQKLTELVSQQTQPVSPAPTTPQVPPQFAISTLTAAQTEPISPVRAAQEAPPTLEMASIATAAETEPIAPPRQVAVPSAMSYIVTAAETEPISPPRQVAVAPEVAPLSTSSMVNAETEPIKEKSFLAPFNFSTIVSQASQPVTPIEETVNPIDDATTPRPARRPDFYTDSGFSPEKEEMDLLAQAQPLRAPLYTDSGFSPDKEDVVIPGTNAIRPGAGFFNTNPTIPPPTTRFPPRTSSIRSLSPERAAYSSNGVDPSVPVYADENAETTQEKRPNSKDSRTPFAAVSNNTASNQRGADARPAYKRTATSEIGTQTVVSSDEIDSMLKNKKLAAAGGLAVGAGAGYGAAELLNPRRSSETVPTSDASSMKGSRRPASPASIRKNVASPAPPLPSDHSMRIAAASGMKPTSAGGNSSSPGSMGPPSMPASAYKHGQTLPPRSRTPSFNHGGAPSIRNGTAMTHRSRGSQSGSVRPTLDIPSPVQQKNGHTHSRASSVTSFASELEERFNISRANIYPEDMPPTTDPRMIQAITQTMIGEHLWKYTRKTGRSSEISGTRHRRFFWVHPYTRTMYWSEHDPSNAGAKQMKAKSVAIEAVRVISDANAYPPGLYGKSLVVVTPGRELVFTAPTQARHETWFNALSYLLLRTVSQREEDINDTLNPLNSELTAEEVDEFNPQVRESGHTRSNSRATGRTKMSLNSYNSRATNRTMSPARREWLGDVPTLAKRDGQRTVTKRPSTNLKTPEPYPRSQSQASQNRDGGNWSGSIRSGFGTLTSRFKSPGGSIRNINANGRSSFSSTTRSKSALSNRRPGESGAYDAVVTEEGDSDEEDLRVAQIERERHEHDHHDGPVNVRSCCGGKHDVGSLNRASGRHALANVHTHNANGTTTSNGHGGSVASRNHSYGASSHLAPLSEPPTAASVFQDPPTQPQNAPPPAPAPAQSR